MRIFARWFWFWLWLAASVAYAIQVAYYADTGVPTTSEVKRAWIYDALVMIAAHKGTPENVIEVQRLFPMVTEDQLLRVIADYWAAEALAYRKFYKLEPLFMVPVEALNAKYRGRLAGAPVEREKTQATLLLAWIQPVAASFLLVALAYYRRHRRPRLQG